jgi:hypothetical protein
MKFHFAKKLVVFLALLWSGAVQAQTNTPGRWLLVFDTSPAMKARLPGTTAALKQFLDTSAGGELREGDSVAVWAYDKVLQRGQNPIEWSPANAAAAGTNLAAWLERLPHLNISSLAALNPSLGRIVGGSERVTVVIFCDGQSPLNFTPYDDGINQNFRESLAERKKSRQPFVVVLRGQQGKYVGCTVNFPPAGISLPPFPPLPPPPKPVAVTPPKPATGSQPSATPSLVITGTNVGTHLNAVPAPAPPAPPTNPTPAVAAPAPTNPPVIKAETTPPPTNIAKPAIAATPITNPPVTTVIVTQVIVKTVETVAAPTNLMPAPVAATTAENQPPAGIIWLFAVAAGLVLVIVATVFFLRRPSHRPQSSLISSSMEDDARRK